MRDARGKEFVLLTCEIVAVGAEEPLAEHMMVADFFRKSMVLGMNRIGRAKG